MTSISLLVPLIVFVFFALRLSLIDASRHILPNKLIFASAVAISASETVLSILSHSWQACAHSFFVAGETVLVYSLLFAMSRGKLGMGDLKYSLVTGLVIGWVSPELWLVCIWLAFTLAAIWALIAIRQGRNGRQSAIAFGPFMSIAVVLCAVSSQMIL